jgi:large subunit ribosomal protein L22
VTDLIRGVEVNKALDILKYNPKEASTRLEKLLLSAIANWQTKNEGVRIEDSNLYVKEIYVDQSRTLKRIRPAPQGRAHRIRKRSNHVTVVLDSLNKIEENSEN